MAQAKRSISEPTPANDDEVQAFVSGVGQRIRSVRRERSLSQRALSDLSGISQRYLAQMESGSGNISLAMLYRLGKALGIHPHEFLNSLPLKTSEYPSPKAKRICLIGLRGAGKSTLGKLLATDIKTKFIELNTIIEEQSGIPIAEVMALYGQEGYRQLERSALDRVTASGETLVLAVGGGIVTEPENFDTLLTNFHTIWLRAEPQDHMERVRNQGDERPMAGNPRAMEELKSILTSREALYERADAMINTSSKSVENSSTEISTIAKRLINT